jgi:hypothetical protein
MSKSIRKWCINCRKIVEVSLAEERCPQCGSPIPIPPHEKFGYPPPVPPGLPPGPGPMPPPPGGEPTHFDIMEILERIETKVDRLNKKTGSEQ